jgi:uncharacterized membrane protein
MKKNSWHYKLAKIGNQDMNIWSGQMSICEYTRRVMVGVIIVSCVTALMLITVGWIGTALYEIIGAIVGFSSIGPAASVLIVTIVILSLMVIGSYAKNKWEDKSRRMLRKEENSFVANAYRSYKDKVCFAVEFEDEK